MPCEVVTASGVVDDRWEVLTASGCHSVRREKRMTVSGSVCLTFGRICSAEYELFDIWPDLLGRSDCLGLVDLLGVVPFRFRLYIGWFRQWFPLLVPAVKAAPSGCMGYADAADGHPAAFRQMTSGCGRWDGGNPADGGGRWSDGKRRSARKNLSKHATHSKKKILKKNDADLKFSIFQTGDFYISNSQNEKKWCNRACVRVRGSTFKSRTQTDSG